MYKKDFHLNKKFKINILKHRRQNPLLRLFLQTLAKDEEKKVVHWDLNHPAKKSKPKVKTCFVWVELAILWALYFLR